MSFPCAASAYIPHTAAMCLIQTLLEAENGQGLVETCLPQTAIVTDDTGCITSVALMEIIAQAYAAVKGFEYNKQGNGFQEAYLVGIQHFHVQEPVYADEELVIAVETIGEFEGFAVIEGSVKKKHSPAEAPPVATAKLKLWTPPVA